MTDAQAYEFGEFRIDAAKRRLSKGADSTVPLMPKAFDILLYLVAHSERIIDKEELMSAIWTDTIVEENNLSQNISILRRTLGEKRGEHRFIATVPGRGFKFVADVRVVSDAGLARPPDSAGRQNATHSQNLNYEVQNGNEGSGFQVERQSDISPDPKPKEYDRKTNLFRFVALASFIVLGLGTIGFYLSSGKGKSVVNAPIRSVAVLPFKPLVAENRDESLEMGMADTLIARLGENREIIVPPLSSVRKFGDLEQDATQAGRQLGVESVLDGNIQRWGDKIRVNVRLVKVADGTSLWTGTFDEKFTDIFVVQDAIAKKVASALAFRASRGEQTESEKGSTSNAEAYELYLRGRYHAFKITEPDSRRAIALYKQAIEADPNYALAYAGLADTYRTMAIAAHAPSIEVCPQAKAFARRALEINESVANAHIVLGWIGFLFDLDWKSSEEEIKRAIELEPNNSEAHRAYAHLLSTTGRHDEAIVEGKRARELAPLTLITLTLESSFLMYAGRNEEAIARIQKIFEIDPNFWFGHNNLGRVYVVQGRYVEAVAAFTRAKELSAGGTNEPVTQLAYALAKSGDRAAARATLAELKSLAAKKYVPAYFFATIYNGLDDKEEALNYLEKSFNEREVQMTFIKVDTRWDEFRSEPRFIALMKKMNFE